MFDVNTTKRKIREAIASVGNEIKFPHDIELNTCVGDNEIMMSGIYYIPETDELFITTEKYGEFSADEWILDENDWYIIDDEVTIAVENINFDRQLNDTNVVSIYAVGLMISTDCCTEHWEETVVTPFYRTKEQALLKYDELVQWSPEEREKLVGWNTAIGGFTIVEEKLSE